jgi:hypothetical protein
MREEGTMMERKWTTGSRLALAGVMLAIGFTGAAFAANEGELRLGAGQVHIQLARGERGLKLDIEPRVCRNGGCGVDLGWRRLRR